MAMSQFPLALTLSACKYVLSPYCESSHQKAEQTDIIEETHKHTHMVIENKV